MVGCDRSRRIGSADYAVTPCIARTAITALSRDGSTSRTPDRPLHEPNGDHTTMTAQQLFADMQRDFATLPAGLVHPPYQSDTIDFFPGGLGVCELGAPFTHVRRLRDDSPKYAEFVASDMERTTRRRCGSRHGACAEHRAPLTSAKWASIPAFCVKRHRGGASVHNWQMPDPGNRHRRVTFATLRASAAVWLSAAVLAGTAIAGTFEGVPAPPPPRYLGSHQPRPQTGGGYIGDHVTTARLLLSLANEGNASAQFVLGNMYFHGEGVRQDYVQAHKWYNLAASRYPTSDTEHRDEAAKNRDSVARNMTPEQIAEAQKLAREWKPK